MAGGECPAGAACLRGEGASPVDGETTPRPGARRPRAGERLPRTGETARDRGRDARRRGDHAATGGETPAAEEASPADGETTPRPGARNPRRRGRPRRDRGRDACGRGSVARGRGRRRRGLGEMPRRPEARFRSGGAAAGRGQSFRSRGRRFRGRGNGCPRQGLGCLGCGRRRPPGPGRATVSRFPRVFRASRSARAALLAGGGSDLALLLDALSRALAGSYVRPSARASSACVGKPPGKALVRMAWGLCRRGRWRRRRGARWRAARAAEGGDAADDLVLLGEGWNGNRQQPQVLDVAPVLRGTFALSRAVCWLGRDTMAKVT